MGVSLKCRDCGYKIPMPQGNWPDSCPNCQGSTALPEGDEVCCPAFLSPKTKATDGVYRQMETASEQRAYAAAEMAGVHVSEMADLKITNLNDRRDAPVAAMPVNNAVTQHMAAMNAKGAQFGFQGGNGREWAAGVGTGDVTVNGQVTKGIEPMAGGRTMSKLQQMLPPIAQPPAPIRP